MNAFPEKLCFHGNIFFRIRTWKWWMGRRTDSYFRCSCFTEGLNLGCFWFTILLYLHSVYVAVFTKWYEIYPGFLSPVNDSGAQDSKYVNVSGNMAANVWCHYPGIFSEIDKTLCDEFCLATSVYKTLILWMNGKISAFGVQQQIAFRYQNRH